MYIIITIIIDTVSPSRSSAYKELYFSRKILKPEVYVNTYILLFYFEAFHTINISRAAQGFALVAEEKSRTRNDKQLFGIWPQV